MSFGKSFLVKFGVELWIDEVLWVIFDLMNEVFFVLDEEGFVFWVNCLVVEVFGYLLESFYGYDFCVFVVFVE